MSEAGSSGEAKVCDYDDHQEYPEFVPVGEELAVLAKYWLTEDLGLCWFSAGYGSSGRERKRRDYSIDRVYLDIQRLIGKEKTDQTIEEVNFKFCEQFSAEERRRFLAGDCELASEMSEEEHRLASSDTQQVFDMITDGSKESPVSSQEIEECLGLAEDQVWQAVRNLALNGKLVCYDPTQLCLPVGQRTLGQPVYWCPASQDEGEAWLETVRAGLSEPPMPTEMSQATEAGRSRSCYPGSRRCKRPHAASNRGLKSA